MLTRTLLAVACLLTASEAALAQKPRVKITAARVGLPPGGRTTERDENSQAVHVAKFAAWAPAYVELEMLAEVKEPAELVIESPDADKITTVLTIPLNLADAKPGQALTARDLGQLPYLRPAGEGESTFTVRTAKGVALSEPFRLRSISPKDSLTYVVLSVGGRLPGFELPKPTTNADASAGLRGGRVELAAITDVSQLPDQWFGYEAADLVVLTTGGGADVFLQRLFGDQASASDKAKRAALLEWVRRGGRLVVSLGSNAGMAAQLPALQELLPFALKADAPARSVPQLVLSWSGRDNAPQIRALDPRAGTIPVANLVPKAARPARVLIPPPGRTSDDKEPVAVQAAFGLGRVTLLGFDIDRAPFTDFGLRPEFWDWILREAGASRASIGNDGKTTRSPSSGVTEDEDELAAALRTHVDTFDGVPVISFGWVAIFIVLYILLIGPVEYFFLKKVLGRLELTWVTFPVIVLTVSAAAYFTAYAVKGRDLKVNKVDVVEIDPATGRVYGTTWFTIFSPRIDTYTAAVTPGEGWGVESADTPALVGWVGGPRGGRPSIVRRRYAYHADGSSVADGLDGVPIAVWSTKSLTANWTVNFDPASPVVESKLLHPPGDPAKVIGTFTNRMPFPEVKDCVAFYAGNAYEIGNVLKGDEVRLVLDKSQPAAQWLQANADMPGLLARQQAASTSRYGARTNTGGSTLPLWGVLFHEAALRNDEGVLPRNSSLRRLDQTWRLNADNRDEVVVVGRVLPTPGPAEDVISGPQSPTRLWLKGLPGGGRARTPIPGTARQETYVRIYLPIKK